MLNKGLVINARLPSAVDVVDAVVVVKYFIFLAVDVVVNLICKYEVCVLKDSVNVQLLLLMLLLLELLLVIVVNIFLYT